VLTTLRRVLFQFFLQPHPDLNTFSKACLLMFPAERTDDVDDFVHSGNCKVDVCIARYISSESLLPCAVLGSNSYTAINKEKTAGENRRLLLIIRAKQKERLFLMPT